MFTNRQTNNTVNSVATKRGACNQRQYARYADKITMGSAWHSLEVSFIRVLLIEEPTQL